MATKTYKSPFDLYRLSYEAVNRNLMLFLFLNIVTFASVAWKIGGSAHDKVNHASWGSVISTSAFGPSYSTVGTGIVLVILFILSIVFALMGLILSVKAAHKDKVELDEVWQVFKGKWLRLIGVELLTAVIVLAGFVALIIPGVYLIGRLAFAPIITVDKDIGPTDAIKQSWHLTEGRMWPVYSVILLSICLAVANVIPFIGPIIAFFLALFYSVALPLRYMEYKKA